MDRSPKYIAEFGPYSLDAANRILLRDGEIVPLKPKVFDTLLALVERPGQVLTKTELMERIWPDTVVEENNLTQNISMLRKILGKNSRGEHYIRTIPRRGYCFTSSIQEVWEESTNFILEKSSRSRIVVEEEQESSEQQATVTDVSIRTGVLSHLASKLNPLSWSITQKVIAISALVAAVAVAVWIPISLTKNRADSDLLSSLSIIHIVNWKSAPGETELRNGAFSHDGEMIVFSSNKDEHNGIWIKQINSGEAVEVIGDEWHNESPIWSPDRQQIAFVSDRGNAPGIWSIPRLGGTPILLRTFEKGWPELKYWSRKNARIYYELESNFYALDLASNQIIQLTYFDWAKLSPPGFSIAPEEDRIAYSAGENGHQDIWVRAVDGGEPFQVTHDQADDRSAVWHPDGESIIYSSNRNGTYQICIAYLDGSPTRQITFGDTNNAVSDVSPDGDKILFIASREEADLFKVEVDSGEELTLTSDIGLELWPDVSPDGKAVAFQAASAKIKMFNSSILSKPADGSGRQTQLAADGFDARWSPDGGNLGYLRFSDDLYNIWVVKATGAEQNQLTRDGVMISGVSGLPYNHRQTRDYSWSPDSSKIAYCSVKSGQLNAWVMAVDMSSDNMISNNTDLNLAILCPLWSPDGNRIAYVATPSVVSAGTRNSLCVWPAEFGKSETIFQSKTPFRLIGWSESGDGLIVGVIKDVNNQQTTKAQIDLFQVSLISGGLRNIASLPSAYLNNIQLSPDRRSVAFVSRQGGPDNIWVVPVSGGMTRKVTKNTDPRVFYSSLAWSPDGKSLYSSKQASRKVISVIDNFTRKDLPSWQRPPNQGEK